RVSAGAEVGTVFVVYVPERGLAKNALEIGSFEHHPDIVAAADHIPDRPHEFVHRRNVLERVPAQNGVDRESRVFGPEKVDDEPHFAASLRSAGVGSVSRIDSNAGRISGFAQLDQELALPATNLQNLLALEFAALRDLFCELSREGVEGIREMLRLLEIRRVSHGRF